MPDVPDGGENLERRRLDDYKFQEFKERMDRFDAQMEKVWQHIDSRFDALHAAINTLQFVRLDVYELHRAQLEQKVADAKRTADENNDETRAIAEAARDDARKLFMLFAGAVVVAVIAALFKAAIG